MSLIAYLAYFTEVAKEGVSPSRSGYGPDSLFSLLYYRGWCIGSTEIFDFSSGGSSPPPLKDLGGI